MSQAMPTEPIEFIRLAGHPVRVTSIRSTGENGERQLVVISRGTRDAELLSGILSSQPVAIAIPGEPEFLAGVSDLDLRTSGEGSTMVSRFAFTLRPWDGAEPARPRSLEERVDALERELAALRALVERLGTSSP